MAGAAISFELKGLSRVEAMARILSDLGDAEQGELLESLGALGVSQTQARLAAGGPDPSGAPWKALSSKYDSQKKTKSSGKILTFHGFLSASLDSEAGAQSVRWGSNREYAAAHQFGDTRRVKIGAHTRLVKKAFGKALPFPVHASIKAMTRQQNIAARPYLGISEANAGEIEAVAVSWLGDLLPAGGVLQ